MQGRRASPVGRRPVMATRTSRPAGRRSLTVFSPLSFFSPLYQRVPGRGVAATAASIAPSAIFSPSIRGLSVLFRTIADLPTLREQITRIVGENCPICPVTRARHGPGCGIVSCNDEIVDLRGDIDRLRAHLSFSLRTDEYATSYAPLSICASI